MASFNTSNQKGKSNSLVGHHASHAMSENISGEGGGREGLMLNEM